MEFNEKLQQLRTGKNLTQEQLAEQLLIKRDMDGWLRWKTNNYC